MLSAGDVVIASMVGATQTKRRPAVVLSTDAYLAVQRDVVIGELTSQILKATTLTDYLLKDWAAAGLYQPTAFRVYLGTVAVAGTLRIGRLTDRDWQEVKNRLRLGLAVV